MAILARCLAPPAAVLIIAACATSSNAPDASPSASVSAPVDAAAEAREAAAEIADAAAEAGDAATESAVDGGGDAPLPGTSEGCVADMVLVHGSYCPEVNQVCLEHHDEYN